MSSEGFDDMKRRIQEIVADELELELGELDETTHFVDGYDADSMTLIQVFGRIERELSVQIPQQEMWNMVDLGSVQRIVGEYAGREIERA
jgi:acyl carrier protein